MQRYKTIKALGDGTYGSVFKAVNRATGDIVAIKVCPDRLPRRLLAWTRSLDTLLFTVLLTSATCHVPPPC